MSQFKPFNAFITPDGQLLKFGSPHDVYAKTRFNTTVPQLKKDGWVRVSWYMFNNVHPLIDTYDLKEALPAIQKALLPYYERLGNISVTAYEQVRRSDKKDDHIIDTDLATLTLGTFRDIREKEPFGVRGNPRGNPDYFVGWASPKGKLFPLKGDDTIHEHLAEVLLVQYYDDPDIKRPIGIHRRWNKTAMLLSKGWVRVVGSNFSVHRLFDSMGRVQTNLLDLIVTLPEDEKVFIDDSFEGDLIYNRSAGWFLDKYQ